MKKISYITVVIIIFALFAIICGAYSFYKNVAIFKIFNGGFNL